MLMLLAGCGNSPTGASSFDIRAAPGPLGTASPQTSNLTGDRVLTPSGRIEIFPFHLYRVFPWHVETAEISWSRVAACVGVEPDSIRAFPVELLVWGDEPCGIDGLAGCLGEGHIEILGSSWDFNPVRPEDSPAATEELARLWRHELIHLALQLRDGDADPEHLKPEWSCQDEIR